MPSCRAVTSFLLMLSKMLSPTDATLATLGVIRCSLLYLWRQKGMKNRNGLPYREAQTIDSQKTSDMASGSGSARNGYRCETNWQTGGAFKTIDYAYIYETASTLPMNSNELKDVSTPCSRSLACVQRRNASVPFPTACDAYDAYDLAYGLAYDNTRPTPATMTTKKSP